MKKIILFALTACAMMCIANFAHGQSSGFISAPTIIYSSNLACQNEEPKIGYSLEEPKICLKVCENSTNSYTVIGQAGSTFSWNISGGSVLGTGTGDSISVEWGALGNGMIAVTETSVDSIVKTSYLCVEIIPSPKALFTILPFPSDSYCINQEISFSDLSTMDNGNIIAWSWDFGDGSYSAERNPTHAWSSSGTYIVVLTVYNECNCSSSYQMKIIIDKGIPITIDCPSIVCEGHTATYSANGACNGYDWSVSGGSIIGQNNNQVTVIWDDTASLTDGFGYLTLNSSLCPNACSKYTTVKIPVITSSTPIVGETTVCQSRQYQYSLPEWPATIFEWEINDHTKAEIVDPAKGKDVFINFKKPGQVILRVHYYNTLVGCSGTSEIHITILPATEITSSSWDNNPVCKNTTLSFNWVQSNNIISGLWLLHKPDGSTLQQNATLFTHTFTMAGTYTLEVEGSGYCSPDAIQIVVNELPPAVDTILGPQDVCLQTGYTYFAAHDIVGTIYGWSITNGTILRQEGNSVTVVWTAFSRNTPSETPIDRPSVLQFSQHLHYRVFTD